MALNGNSGRNCYCRSLYMINNCISYIFPKFFYCSFLFIRSIRILFNILFTPDKTYSDTARPHDSVCTKKTPTPTPV